MGFCDEAPLSRYTRGLAVDLLIKNRKVPADGLDVERRSARLFGHGKVCHNRSGLLKRLIEKFIQPELGSVFDCLNRNLFNKFINKGHSQRVLASRRPMPRDTR